MALSFSRHKGILNKHLVCLFFYEDLNIEERDKWMIALIEDARDANVFCNN